MLDQRVLKPTPHFVSYTLAKSALHVATRMLAQRLGIKLASLDEVPELDLTADGADEIAPDLSLIKGGRFPFLTLITMRGKRR